MVWLRLRRWARGLAVAGLLAAAVPLGLWAVPAMHGPPVVTVEWIDYGTLIQQHAARHGLDRQGYAYQEQLKIWEAPDAAQLTGLRRAHAADPAQLVRLPPADSGRLQYTGYGANHVYLPGGLEVSDAGEIHTLPYSVVAAMLAAPAAGLAVRRAWRSGSAMTRRIR